MKSLIISKLSRHKLKPPRLILELSGFILRLSWHIFMLLGLMFELPRLIFKLSGCRFKQSKLMLLGCRFKQSNLVFKLSKLTLKINPGLYLSYHSLYLSFICIKTYIPLIQAYV